MNLELKMDIGALVELLVTMGAKSSEVEQVDQEKDQEKATKKKRDPFPLPREKRQWTWEDPMWATDPNVKAYMAKPEVSWKSTDFEEGTIFRLSDPAQKAATKFEPLPVPERIRITRKNVKEADLIRFPPESGPASSSQRLPERRLPRASEAASRSEAASSSSAAYYRSKKVGEAGSTYPERDCKAQ